MEVRFVFSKEANVDEMEQILVDNGIHLQLNKDNQYVIEDDEMEKIKEIPEVWYYVNEID